ncbi:DNA repair protein XRCC4-like isoform X1 [Sinocyclocheilus anshuiensis]|uniref:DNA repair protein XRCC4-like isoform X1 n=1 Tax=Sinocyclocheilus anshuiensis TaxID=1608454 RepID=UPI0007B9ED58|nr:PREDICTED: DNA repair protein XRCC4-like isoform X1 [Sinocyclocheilus anshuiensis]
MRCCSTSVRQISIASEPHRTFFLKLEWAEDLGSGFVILLSDGISAWSGEVSEEDVSREAQEIEMERERYVGDLQLALTGEGPAAEGEYSFHLTPERPGHPLLQLSYEKVQNDISFRLGVVDLQAVPEPTEVIRELISHGLEQSARLQAKNQHLLEENQKLRREQEHITKEMQRYVQGKEKLERDLYSRFVLVLNEKKVKLRALQKSVKELEKSVEENRLRKKADSEDHKAMETAADKSPGESDYGGSTEDEQEAEHRQPDPKPLTQEMPESNPMDDSLNDITDVAPCRKRRHRHLQQLETQAKRAALDQRQRSSQADRSGFPRTPLPLYGNHWSVASILYFSSRGPPGCFSLQLFFTY